MLQPVIPSVDYGELIQENSPEGFRVHGSLYYDERIFQQEMERIFHNGWVYVGHASEIPNPGDFRTRAIGTQPVILCRDETDEIHVLLNRCIHRGATVCQEYRGNTKYFRCAYHGWIYHNSGKLVEVTMPKGFGRHQPGKGLFQAPRVRNHRGFVFASLAVEGVSFENYLGRAGDYLGRYSDLAPDGELMVSAGSHGLRVDSNWKMQLENLPDAHHAGFVHKTALLQFFSRAALEKTAPLGALADPQRPNQFQRYLGDGHSILDMFASNRSLGKNLKFTGSTGTLDPRVIDGIAKREGSREKAEWLVRGGGSHIMVFPNLMVLWDAIRVIQPISVERTEIHYYPALLKGAPADINTARLRSHEGSFGPAGFIAPDDMEMFERNQLGMQARGDEWSVLNRGIDDERMEEDDFGQPALTTQQQNETAQRGIWRHYKTIMQGT